MGQGGIPVPPPSRSVTGPRDSILGHTGPVGPSPSTRESVLTGCREFPLQVILAQASSPRSFLLSVGTVGQGRRAPGGPVTRPGRLTRQASLCGLSLWPKERHCGFWKCFPKPGTWGIGLLRPGRHLTPLRDASTVSA